jgi:glycosyltransferase involved in cell wall biosynthesis
MLVSVVMPVYNAALYLKAAIESLLNQTYSDWELIAVDDGSTDSSREILRSFTDKRIRIFERTNGGQCAATNTGLEKIAGDCVLFFDADDLMDPHKIETQVKALKANPGSVAVGKWSLFEKHIEEGMFNEEPIYYSGTPDEWLYRLWSHDTMMPNHGYLIPRSVMEKAGTFYDETILLNVDFEYFTRIVLAAESIIYCPDSICYYRKGVKTSKTYSPSISKQLSALYAREKSIKLFLEKYHDARSKQAARMAISILTFSYPAIRRQAKASLARLGLEKFADFGGKRFKRVSAILGFEKAIQIKGLYEKLR